MRGWVCRDCGQFMEFPHDHKADATGLDDGPQLVRTRKKMVPKSRSEYAAIRVKAWATRRKLEGTTP